MMTELLYVYFAVTYTLTLLLGFMQAPLVRHSSELSAPEWPIDGAAVVSPKTYGVVAVTMIIIQAAVSVGILCGTSAFPIAAFFVGFTLLCHHTIIHRNSRFDGETCSCAPFQCKDISNHETWVVAALVAATISQFHV
jgi:hypothetical protein